MSVVQIDEFRRHEPFGFVTAQGALRPSRRMTYQAALAGLPLDDDALIVDEPWSHAAPATAHGVYHAMLAAVERRFDRRDLQGVSVAVLGFGAVGQELCRRLLNAGARLHLADRNPDVLQAAARTFRAVPVPLDRVRSLEVDVLAPCDEDGVFDDDTVGAVRASIVCGSADGQLAEDRHGIALHEQGVLYVPDYVANAGAAIHVANMLAGERQAVIRQRIEAIGDICRRVFEVAELNGIATSEAADRLAEVVVRGKRERAMAAYA